MCATLLGAASTAHSELRIDTPTSVVVESEDSVMMVMGAGRKALLVTVVPGDVDRGALEKRLAGLVDTIKLI
jgi:predicted regulator of Ras-like GTPase activity (Roadblock/LC7/MglB family)